MINANARVAGPRVVPSALARLAARPEVPESIRVEALHALAAWASRRASTG